MNILVVDDSLVVRKMVKSILEERGCSVELAENGQVALDVLKGGKVFDVVLLDWNMPVMNGPGFLEEKSKLGIQHSPVIMMTTESSMDHMQKAIELGAEEYIVKPFTADIVFGKIDMIKDAA